MPADGTTRGEVSAGDAEGLIRTGALLLDVRENDEWDAGRVSGAQYIPLGQPAERDKELRGYCQVIVVCRSGVRPARAATFLSASGFDAVNLAGGMHAWAAVGLPSEAAAGAPGVVT